MRRRECYCIYHDARIVYKTRCELWYPRFDVFSYPSAAIFTVYTVFCKYIYGRGDRVRLIIFQEIYIYVTRARVTNPRLSKANATRGFSFPLFFLVVI